MIDFDDFMILEMYITKFNVPKIILAFIRNKMMLLSLCISSNNYLRDIKVSKPIM